MKIPILSLSVAVILFVKFHADAGVVAGPITNPSNGHEYYLLSPNSWTESETEAENLGGTLAIIRNADEQQWVFSTFGSYAGTNRNLWIGLHRRWQGGPFAWVTGEKIDYVNWAAGNPDNFGGVESCVLMYQPKDVQPGKWNDFSDTGRMNDPICGVVEVQGKASEKALTGAEKSLIGTWYEHGDSDLPCWIAGTGNMIFAIDHDRNTSRLISISKRTIFAVNWRQHAEVLKDQILWSEGNWWSREPMEYMFDDFHGHNPYSQQELSGDTEHSASWKYKYLPFERWDYSGLHTNGISAMYAFPWKEQLRMSELEGWPTPPSSGSQ